MCYTHSGVTTNPATRHPPGTNCLFYIINIETDDVAMTPSLRILTEYASIYSQGKAKTRQIYDISMKSNYIVRISSGSFKPQKEVKE